MDRRSWNSDVLRLVRGVRGHVSMRTELIVRFDYGTAVPWFTQVAENRWMAVAGPDRLMLATPVQMRGQDLRTVAEFDVAEGQEIPFSLTWSRSFAEPPDVPDVKQAVEKIAADWIAWSDQGRVDGPWHEPMLRSLITLKALTHHQTGGIVAAPTTSLPEQVGGTRNWDYRLCWLRDATMTLYALMHSGFLEEAKAWREWLLRAIAGSPAQMQTVYGVAGERRLTEIEIPGAFRLRRFAAGSHRKCGFRTSPVGRVWGSGRSTLSGAPAWGGRHGRQLGFGTCAGGTC